MEKVQENISEVQDNLKELSEHVNFDELMDGVGSDGQKNELRKLLYLAGYSMDDLKDPLIL